MPDKTDKEWTDRDEIAERVFEAIIMGAMAHSGGLPPDAPGEARSAYRFADAFLTVRDEEQARR